MVTPMVRDMRKPGWLKVKIAARRDMRRVAGVLRDLELATVCEEALCPNRWDCFSRDTATFMILGTDCSRRCPFCAVGAGAGKPPDPSEPQRVAAAVRRLGLRHVVITSVTRDDLGDGGARHFAATVASIKDTCGDVTVEVLVPDFGGSRESLRCVLAAGPDVLNHNLETVPRLYATVRPGSVYQRSLDLLEMAKEMAREMGAGAVTKSGLMLGLGEEENEVLDVMRDLRRAGCDVLTLGQYLQPSRAHLPVSSYIPPRMFARYRRLGHSLGFRLVFAGPLVRSSFHAGAILGSVRGRRDPYGTDG